MRDASPTAAIPVSADYSVAAGQSQTFDNMQTNSFEPTTGDCTMVDTSKLQRQDKSGEVLRLVTMPVSQGKVIVQIAFEQRKFLDTKHFKFNQSCTVNNASSDIVQFEQTILLTAGEQPILLRALPGLKMFSMIQP